MFLKNFRKDTQLFSTLTYFYKKNINNKKF